MQRKAWHNTPPACTSEVAIILIEAPSLDSMSSCKMALYATAKHDLDVCLCCRHHWQVRPHTHCGFLVLSHTLNIRTEGYMSLSVGSMPPPSHCQRKQRRWQFILHCIIMLPTRPDALTGPYFQYSSPTSCLAIPGLAFNSSD